MLHKWSLVRIAAIAVLMMTAQSKVQSAVGTGASFLKVGAGARAAAMGDAYSAVADDVTAMYWNPAGMLQVKKEQFTVGHVEGYEEVRHEYFGYCRANKKGAYGFSAMYSWVSGVEGREFATPEATRMVPVWDVAPAFSMAYRSTKNLSLGGTVKGIYQQLDDKTAYGCAVDAALMYKLNRKMKLGCGLYNFGYETPFVSEDILMPSTVRVGIAGSYLKNRLTVACDGVYGVNDQVITGSLGGEMWVVKRVALRAGYKYNSTITEPAPLQGFTSGFGLELDKFIIDYAFVPAGETLVTHRLSVTTKFK